MLADVDTIAMMLAPTVVSTKFLQELAQSASGAVQRYTGRTFESTTIVEYHSGNGNREIVLRQTPVQSITEMRMDSLGAYGQAAGQFDSTTILIAGQDYSLMLDQPPGSRCGLVRRLGIRYGGGWFDYMSQPHSLAGVFGAVWPIGDGNIKVTYVVGFAPRDVPFDLKHAAAMLAVRLYLTRKTAGQLYQSERLGEYSYQLLAFSSDDDIGTIRGMLRPWKDLTM